MRLLRRRMILGALVAMASGCAMVRHNLNDVRPQDATSASSSPSQPWKPPAGALPSPDLSRVTDVRLPSDFTPGMPVSLGQIIDVALSNNPSTRIAWLQARSAEAEVGSRRAAWLPQIDLNGSLVRSRSAAQAGRLSLSQTTFGPSLALNQLLFDFGGRSAQVDEARAALISANLLHNQSIQDVILRAETAYYRVLDGSALLAAQNATIKERQTFLDAADARHRAGVATIADVLQARTALSQATLARETIEGDLRIAEGQMATVMGLPPATRFDVGSLPIEVPAREIATAVEELIRNAVAARPDLNAARAGIMAAEARVREVRSQGLPSIGLSSSVGRVSSGASTAGSIGYSAGVFFRWPIFTGFRNTDDLRQAQLRAEAERENARRVEQGVGLEVWTSYHSMQTASQRLTTVRDLLKSAQESADVAAGRYRAGVGRVVDLLTAEAALENARAEEVRARTDWFLSIARLAHDTGTLTPHTTEGK